MILVNEARDETAKKIGSGILLIRTEYFENFGKGDLRGGNCGNLSGHATSSRERLA